MSSQSMRLTQMRILGLPLQFVVVLVVSVALAIYLMAAVADSRVEARTREGAVGGALGGFYAGAGGISTVPSVANVDGLLQNGEQSQEGQAQGWENAFLFACPLH